MRIDVVTLFPRMFDGVIGDSILKIAREKGLVEINLVDLRDFTLDKHKKVDAPPFGGGPGMVLMADPVFRAVEHLRAAGAEKSTLVLLSASGTPFDHATARRFSAAPGLILLCGHYEGVDERIVEGLKPLEISLGDFVLTGGEVPAMAVVDAVTRLLPGVLGCAGSLEDESFADGRLEYPHYTRPREYRDMKVPDVLLNGNHEEIRKWRRKMAEDRTLARRPDLKRSPPTT